MTQFIYYLFENNQNNLQREFKVISKLYTSFFSFFLLQMSNYDFSHISNFTVQKAKNIHIPIVEVKF